MKPDTKLIVIASVIQGIVLSVAMYYLLTYAPLLTYTVERMMGL